MRVQYLWAGVLMAVCTVLLGWIVHAPALDGQVLLKAAHWKQFIASSRQGQPPAAREQASPAPAAARGEGGAQEQAQPAPDPVAAAARSGGGARERPVPAPAVTQQPAGDGGKVSSKFVQLGFISAMQPKYIARLEANLNEWSKDFEHILGYAYDIAPVPPNLTRFLDERRVSLSLVTPFGPEEKTGHNNNLHLIAFDGMIRMNPHAKWYFLVEDDTVVWTPNLLLMIESLRNKQGDIYKGKCALEVMRAFHDDIREKLSRFSTGVGVPFVVG
eukprot:CAMPEP_0206217260 /NCGR_PEP_ID=MMETSP0047_2-20121206/3179_1 /ASSEMBLY_ACC=CAM_ASM_000192 /TAXON_ID=195065 /ORGANISM="Chroomonas mesostigmatica_cf, Strain CCMP1168" /LENGTH=272 /DNA_ID=CAMNT_0053639701 /DNA_START=89 /DNA_END=903 /DNA_ORIENTATION=+